MPSIDVENVSIAPVNEDGEQTGPLVDFGRVSSSLVVRNAERRRC